MDQKALILEINNDRISWNSSLSIPINRTNIPRDHLTFNTHKAIFWKVEVENHDGNCLRVKVQSYTPDDTSIFDSQQIDGQVDQILFEKFDWGELEPQLMTYKKIDLLAILTNLQSDPFSKAQISHQEATRQVNRSDKHLFFSAPQLKTINDEFSVSFTDVVFKNGYVTFKRVVKGVPSELDFKIFNNHILQEFDSIKLWFSKWLKVKRIRVSVSIDLMNYEVTGYNASSTQVAQITPELIDSIKYQRAVSLTKRDDIASPDKNLFTHEEILNRIDMDTIPGNALNQTEDDILGILREKGGVRNQKQLAYLAVQKQDNNYKLYFTLRPNFGFMFFIESSNNNHFVWELLNSNATYVWSFRKTADIQLQFKRMHEIINVIRTDGRNNYKLSYSNSLLESELVFKAISHDNISSESFDSFPLWKSKLNELLT